MNWAIAAGLFVIAAIGMVFFTGPIAVISLPAERLHPDIFVTNTMLAAWLTLIVLTVLSLRAAGNMQMVPRGVQNLMEFVIESLFAFVTSIAGQENGRKFFPLVATIFLFIITSAWLALLPGFSTIGVVQAPHGGHGVPFTVAGPVAFITPGTPNPSAGDRHDDHGAAMDDHAPAMAGDHAPAATDHGAAAAQHGVVHLPDGRIEGTLVPVLRSANTDLNTPLAIALVAMFMVQYWGIQALGLSYFSKFINFSQGPIGVFVGVLELISEVSKVVSFTFRLFGNMFAGEVLLAVISFLVPMVAVLPFLGLELFVGFVQALVFAGLTLVFAAGAVAGHGEHEEGHGSGDGHAAESGAPAHAAAPH